MKLSMTKIKYKTKCDMDGCGHGARFAVDGVSLHAAGRLHLCRTCLRQIARLYFQQLGFKKSAKRKDW